jgi:beta-glucosidase
MLHKLYLSACVLGAGLVVQAADAQPEWMQNQQIYHDDWIDFNKNGKKDLYEDPSIDVERRVEDLLSQMNNDEKTCQLVTLYGYTRVLKDPLPTDNWKNEIWKDGLANIDEQHNGVRGGGKEYCATPAEIAKNLNLTQRFFVEDTRLGIPVDFTNEGIRGLCAKGATNFPAQIGIGCTWNKELVRKIGDITGKEAKALGYTNVYAPILDVARDPRWGRVVECYGEDPYMVSQYGVEMVNAIQKYKLAASPKHFAVYSIPKGGRDGSCRTDPHVAPREMHTLYLAPFKAAFKDAGALGAMSSYNDYDGIPVTSSSYFLDDLLRKEWGFKGYVVSDSNAVKYVNSKHRVAVDYKDAVKHVINAGMNVRTTFNHPKKFVDPLRKLVKEGLVTQKTLDERVRDVLRVKFLVGLFDKPYVNDPEDANKVLRNAEHEAVSLQASRESIVLLKNADNVLPLNKSELKSIAVIGPNARAVEPMTSRYGPYEPKVITVLEGIEQAVGDKVRVEYALGSEVSSKSWPLSEILPCEMSANEKQNIADAVDTATRCDVAVVVLGDNRKTVGESVSRTSLQLPGYQQQLLEAVYKTGKPVIVVLVSGRPMAINWADKYCPAIIEAWFPGSYCGQAIAETIFGDYNPGGKLSVTFPRTVGQIPLNFPAKPGSQAGQSKKGNPNGFGRSRIGGALYPFGFGLSYTTFKYSNIKLSAKKVKPGDSVTVSFNVTNTGKRAGDEVVQLYLKDNFSSVTQYEKLLRGFERIHLKVGETKLVSFTLTGEDMQLLNRDMQWVVEPGTFTVMVGSNSDTMHLKSKFDVK